MTISDSTVPLQKGFFLLLVLSLRTHKQSHRNYCDTSNTETTPISPPFPLKIRLRIQKIPHLPWRGMLNYLTMMFIIYKWSVNRHGLLDLLSATERYHWNKINLQTLCALLWIWIIHNPLMCKKCIFCKERVHSNWQLLMRGDKVMKGGFVFCSYPVSLDHILLIQSLYLAISPTSVGNSHDQLES